MENTELTPTELQDMELTALFESYYKGTMNEMERTAFEQRLTDAELRKRYELHCEVMDAIERKGMKQDLQRITAPKTILFRPVFKYAAAACVVAIIAFGSGMFYDAATLQSMGEAQFAKIDVSSARGSSYDAALSAIHTHIEAKQFDEAQTAIDELRTTLQTDSETNYANTEEMEYNKQIIKLTTDNLDWYQTILYMDNHNVFKARRWLRKISDSDSRYSQDAGLIYESLLF